MGEKTVESDLPLYGFVAGSGAVLAVPFRLAFTGFQ